MVSSTQQPAAPAVQQLGEAVLYQGAAAAEAARILSAAVVQHRVDGIRPSALLRDMCVAALAATEHAAQAGDGTSEARQSVDPSVWVDEIDIAEAVEMIKLSPEYVRRLAQRGRLGPARLVKRRWRVSKAGVLAYLDDRARA